MFEATQYPGKAGFSANRLANAAPVLQGYIDRQETGAVLALVERKGEIVHASKHGCQDIDQQTPIGWDSIFRIHSMSKPIVSLGLMMLFEEARFQLDDPIWLYLPEFKDARVWAGEGQLAVPKSPPTIRQLLTHTSGLTYGAFGNTPVDKLYREANLRKDGIDLAEMVRRIADLPLLYHPGQRWVYSVATSVVGRLIEILSGKSLDVYLQERIFEPLGMADTFFSVPDDKLQRLTTCYKQTLGGGIAVHDGVEDSAYRNVTLFRGGGGLLSTIGDYLQFARLVLGKGSLGDVSLLSPQTMDLMGRNHIPLDWLPLKIVEPLPGLGFGLGFSVKLDPAQTGVLGSVGELNWAGLASTTFWVDPAEELVAVLMTQLIPFRRFRLEDDFRNLIYQAKEG